MKQEETIRDKKEKKNLKSIDHAKLIKHIMVCGVIKINDEGSVDFSFIIIMLF